MAKYSIKLVDHVGSEADLKSEFRTVLQGFFTKTFDGSSDSATVTWGTGDKEDTIIVHFVEDIASSYITQKMTNARINPRAGGHTKLQKHKVCSEVYYTVATKDGTTRTLKGPESARLAYHECLHNVFPNWTEDDLKGHGGLAETPVGADIAKFDIETMRRGIAIKSNYTQQL